MTVRLTRHTLLLASAMTLAAAWHAHAAPLPWLNDPWNVRKDVGRYGVNLRPAACPADNEALVQPLKLNTVVIRALCNNPTSRAAYLSLLAQGDSYGNSHAAYLPTVTATLNRSRTTEFADGGKNTSQAKGSGLTASMLLYDFGQREASLDVAEQSLIAAGHSYDSSMQGMIAAALQGYYRLLTSQNAVKVAEESERFARASFEAAELKHSIGQVALADKLQAKGSYSQALLSTQQAHNQLALSKSALALLIGIPPTDELEVSEIDDQSLTVDPFDDKVPQLMEEAKRFRNDLAAQRAAVKGSEASLRALKRSQLATISAGVDMGFDDADIFNTATTRTQAIGVSVSIPIFTGFSHTYTRHATQRRLEAQREQLAQTEHNVEQDVWTAWHNYQTARLSWDTSFDQLNTATQLKDVSLGRYKEGIGTILDVLNAQSQYSSALQSQLQTRYNLLTTRVDLVRAVGVLDLDSIRLEAVEP